MPDAILSSGSVCAAMVAVAVVVIPHAKPWIRRKTSSMLTLPLRPYPASLTSRQTSPKVKSLFRLHWVIIRPENGRTIREEMTKKVDTSPAMPVVMPRDTTYLGSVGLSM